VLFRSTISNRPIWWHYVSVAVPDQLKIPDAAFMYIESGNNENPEKIPQPTDEYVQLVSMFAVSSGVIAANLQQIPNTYIVFKKDPEQKKRSEDAIIAWTWKAFMENTSDTNILLRFPMTKAAVKAMDSITDFTKNKGLADIKKFMIAGASKRGWTTWTTAAVDNKRVFAAAPLTMDLLNLNTNLHHHYRSLGAWTFFFKDYYALNITKRVDSPEIFALQRLVDPYYYLDRYTNTKLLVTVSSGDEFFIPDDWDYFWTNLRTATNGSVLGYRIPNAGHTFDGYDQKVFLNMRSFFLTNYYNQKLPKVTWTRPNNETHGITRVIVDIANGPAPSDITVYYAQTLDNKRRDFRVRILDPNDPGKLIPNPVIWYSNSKIIQAKKTDDSIIYTAAFVNPLSGWLGFYFQLTFPGLEDTILEVSSEANIIPDIFPYDDCFQQDCFGKLV